MTHLGILSIKLEHVTAGNPRDLDGSFSGSAICGATWMLQRRAARLEAPQGKHRLHITGTTMLAALAAWGSDRTGRLS